MLEPSRRQLYASEDSCSFKHYQRLSIWGANALDLSPFDKRAQWKLSCLLPTDLTVPAAG